MNISQAGVQFVASNEGFSAHAYSDHKGQSIGYGHLILPGESFPNGVTQEEALNLLGKDCAKVDTAMEAMQAQDLIPATVTQNQWDCCGDFAYNEGITALHEMLRHGWAQVPEQILRWCYMHVDGQLVKSAGLLARRQKELALFQTP